MKRLVLAAMLLAGCAEYEPTGRTSFCTDCDGKGSRYERLRGEPGVVRLDCPTCDGKGDVREYRIKK